jgi:hypothetical protein
MSTVPLAAVSAWVRSVSTLDVRSLCLFRVCLGLVALRDVLVRTDTLDFYTDVGSFIQPAGDSQHRCLFHQLWFYRGSWQVQAVLFGLTAVSSLCLAIGLHTPLASIVTWLGMTSIHGRNECINDSSDKMLRNVLFWATLLPLGAHFSVDRHRQQRLRRQQHPPPACCWLLPDTSTATPLPHHGHARHSIASPGGAGLLLQVVCLYLAVCWRRRHSREWVGLLASGFGPVSDGQQLLHGDAATPAEVDFSAVFLMLASPFAANPVAHRLALGWPAGLGATLVRAHYPVASDPVAHWSAWLVMCL